MTIETKMLTPINSVPIDSVYALVEEYRELEHFIDNCYYGNEIELSFEDIRGDDISFIVEDGKTVSEITKALLNKMERLEYDLNILGYTMQDEPKEWKYHVNIVKGEEESEE